MLFAHGFGVVLGFGVSDDELKVRVSLLAKSFEHDVEPVMLLMVGISTAVLYGVPSSLSRTGTASLSPMEQARRPPHNQGRKSHSATTPLVVPMVLPSRVSVTVTPMEQLPEQRSPPFSTM